MSTDSTCNGRLILSGLVLCLAALADPEAQRAASARLPLTPPVPSLAVIGPFPVSADTNQGAPLLPQNTAVVPPEPEPLSPEAKAAVKSPPRRTPDPVAATVSKPRPSPLVWDAAVKEYYGCAGETNAQFTFSVTNTGPIAVLITEARTSCGCVVATLPEYPWRLAGGTNGLVQVIADLRGQRGLLHKMIYVQTAEHGIQSLAIKVNIPDATP